jgi:hypothetical protein
MPAKSNATSAPAPVARVIFGFEAPPLELLQAAIRLTMTIAATIPSDLNRGRHGTPEGTFSCDIAHPVSRRSL